MHSRWFDWLIQSRFVQTIQFLTQYRLKEALASIVVVGSLGLGISLVAIPERFVNVPTFTVTFEWAQPEVWGSLLITLSCLLAIAMSASRRQGMWPAFGLTCVFGVITTSILVAYPSNVVPSAIWVYLTMTMVCALLTASCTFHIVLTPSSRDYPS